MRNFLIILLLFATLQSSEEYALGEGFQVGELPLYIGGYASLDYRHLNGEDRYRIDDIAILGYGSYNKFSYMAEFEFKEFYVVQTYENQASTSTDNHHLYTERLYLDYNINEYHMLRVGKYNSPIGFWNLLPINVLRETTSSPVSTTIIFPKFTTGLGASYTSYSSGELKVDLMLQNNKDLDDAYNNYIIDKHYAFGITYEKEDYTVKLNSGFFHKYEADSTHNDLYYILLSAKYEVDNYQLLAEAGKQKSKYEPTTEYAGYIQGLYRFSEQHIGIVRAEAYNDNIQRINEELLILGYTYRPLYPIAIKSEYQLHSKSEFNQVLFSLSVLF